MQWSQLHKLSSDCQSFFFDVVFDITSSLPDPEEASSLQRSNWIFVRSIVGTDSPFLWQQVSLGNTRIKMFNCTKGGVLPFLVPRIYAYGNDNHDDDAILSKIYCWHNVWLLKQNLQMLWMKFTNPPALKCGWKMSFDSTSSSANLDRS